MAKYETLTSLFKAIADLIRAKEESSDPIMADNFPDRIEQNFEEAIAIEDALIERYNMETYTNNRVTRIGCYAFAGMTRLRTNLNSKSLTSVHFENLTIIDDYAFGYCLELKEVYAPNLEHIELGAFSDCGQLNNVCFPKLTYIGNSAFSHCEQLSVIDILGGVMHGGAFNNCLSLITLILRSDDYVSILNGANNFNGTPIANGAGYIYVPASMVNAYKTAENWSTYASQFRALEDYTVDGTISGELDKSKI